MPEPGRVELQAWITELERELRYRSSLYPKWVAAGSLKKEDAAIQLQRLREIIVYLKRKVQPDLLGGESG